MKLTDHQLCSLYHEATAAAPAPSDSCPDGDTLLRSARGELGSDEQVEVVDHLITCAGCAETVRLLRSLEGWAREAGVRQPARETVSSLLARAPARRLSLGLAAMVLVAAALGVLWRWQSHPFAPDVLRGHQAAPVVRLPTPANGALLDTAPRVLSWSTDHLPGSRFVVWVYDARATPLWSSEETTATSVTLPQPVREQLQPGNQYYWRVVETRGATVLNGLLLRFEVSPATSSQ